jgi:hypothetical protein
MNISPEHQVVWLAHERCATRITKKIFEDYNFFRYSQKDKEEYLDFKYYEHSFSNFIPEKFQNLKKIISCRNPYDMFFSFFVNSYNSEALTKKKTNVRKNFNNWIQKSLLNHGFYVFMTPKYGSDQLFFNKWKFNNEETVDYTLRAENLYQDLLKLPFIKSKNEIDRQKMQELLNDNPFLNKRYFIFNDLYDTKSAKLVYHFYKPYFYKFDYDPFSFTKDTLSNDEKIQFLHGVID